MDIEYFIGCRATKPKRDRVRRLITRTSRHRRESPSAIRRQCALKFSIGHTDNSLTMNNPMTASIVTQANTTDGEILTVQEVARFLRVPKSTVYKLARVGELPASKIGKHWRFLRRDIHDWMHSRSQAA